MVTRGKKKPKPRRDRAATEQRLMKAVQQLIVRSGFASLTPSAIAREADCDKMLIYRYFGDLNGLTGTVAKSANFFPTFEEVTGGDPAAIARLSVGARAARLAINYARVLASRPAVLELMAWEMIERNALTAIMETQREEMGLRLVREFFGDVTNRSVGAIAAILAAATGYLLLRRRKIRWFNGIDLRSDEGWKSIEDAVRMMTSVLD